jgi:hypothetical protein
LLRLVSALWATGFKCVLASCVLFGPRGAGRLVVLSQYLVLPTDSISSELWALWADSPWQQAGLSYLCVVKQSLKNKEKATGETNWWARSPCCGCKSFHPCGHLVDSWGVRAHSLNQTGETEWQLQPLSSIVTVLLFQITSNNKTFE